jgi:hypothetical protein
MEIGVRSLGGRTAVAGANTTLIVGSRSELSTVASEQAPSEICGSLGGLVPWVGVASLTWFGLVMADAQESWRCDKLAE